MLRMLRWGCYVQMLASSLFCFGNWQFSHSLVERDVVNVGLELCSCLLTCLALRIALFFHCPLSHLSLASSRVVWTVSWDWLVERFRVAASEKKSFGKILFFFGVASKTLADVGQNAYGPPESTKTHMKWTLWKKELIKNSLKPEFCYR